MEELEDLPTYMDKMAEMIHLLTIYRATNQRLNPNSDILSATRSFESSLAFFCEQHRPPQIGLYALHALIEVWNGNVSDQELDRVFGVENFRDLFFVSIENFLSLLKDEFPDYASIFEEAMNGLHGLVNCKIEEGSCAFDHLSGFPAFAGLIEHETSEGVQHCSECNSDNRKTDEVTRLRERLVGMYVATNFADNN